MTLMDSFLSYIFPVLEFLYFFGDLRARGGGDSSIVKVPGDVPPARVYVFKLSSLAKGIYFSSFSPFSVGKGMLFWLFRSKKCQTSVILVKKPKFWSLDCRNLASFV